MIYTVTLNPSVDYIVHVDQLEIGELNRMTEDFKLPGGKGINVSRILKRLGYDTTALGLLGGFTGGFIADWLKHEGIMTAFTTIAQDTRINIKLKAAQETEINGLGPVVTNEEMQELKQALSKIQQEDIVILSGSKPPTLHQHFYAELIQIIKDKAASFVIDTTGKDLKDALADQPLLVKPNREELEDLYQVRFDSIASILPYGKQLLASGPQFVLVSLGGDGALLFSEQGIYQSNVPKGQLRNSVGAGDSMIAGFIGTYAATKDPLKAFKYGVAAGSATAFADDLASGDAILDLLDEIEIKQL